MKTDVCGACIHFPLCYGMWRVEARNPCKHKIGARLGFFRSKAERTALEVDNAAKDEALRKAIDVIRMWHSVQMDATSADQAWKIYRGNAPEMGPIIAALSPPTGMVPVDRDWLEENE